MAEPPPWWDGASKNLKKDIVEANKEELRSALAPVLKDVSECKERLSTVESKQEEMQKEIDAMKGSIIGRFSNEMAQHQRILRFRRSEVQRRH